ncbi:MAG: hypothetical protein GX464_14075, partial [Holophagae bacterium]|nr:hypothetical protein [Holophagae bacterium]
MHRFCYQCRETGENKGCMIFGACGKSDETANLQDLLIQTLREIALAAEPSRTAGQPEREAGLCVAKGLFATVTNTNFDPERIATMIEQAFEVRDALRACHASALAEVAHDALSWYGRGIDELRRRSVTVDIRDTRDEDVRSLRELSTYGLKGAGAISRTPRCSGPSTTHCWRGCSTPWPVPPRFPARLTSASLP